MEIPSKTDWLYGLFCWLWTKLPDGLDGGYISDHYYSWSTAHTKVLIIKVMTMMIYLAEVARQELGRGAKKFSWIRFSGQTRGTRVWRLESGDQFVWNIFPHFGDKMMEIQMWRSGSPIIENERFPFGWLTFVGTNELELRDNGIHLFHPHQYKGLFTYYVSKFWFF